MRIEKCQVGYIKQEKKVNWLWLLAFIVIALAVFIAGYLWTHTRANVFTVLSVLMVLPAAKRVVGLVVFLPRKGVDRARYEFIHSKAKEGILLAEYVFTSTEKIMHLDFVLIWKGKTLAVVAPSIQDKNYMIHYLEENVHRIAKEYEVKVFEKDEELLDFLEKNSGGDLTVESDEKVAAHLRTLAV